jgi:pyruvate dehydrogenase E2 component (dihydrolipoyllysine-residue acetyltransferase)
VTSNGSGAVHPARVRSRRRARPGFRSPAVRRLATEHHLEPDAITGTGADGRVTRDDVLALLKSPPASEVVALNRVQRLTGEHLLRSLQVAPHAFIAMAVDLERVDRARRPAKLTYLPFVARAVVDAIAQFPHVNASVCDGELVVHHDVHLGVAVDLDHQGLVVPVVRQAHLKRLRALGTEMADLAARARASQLAPDDVAGGTFTITNPGPYGTAISAPIIHQPQVAILSTDGVRRRPVVVELDDGTETIAIHAVGMLGLSFDHRAFDGAYAAAFLARVRDVLESRDWHSEL